MRVRADIPTILPAARPRRGAKYAPEVLRMSKVEMASQREIAKKLGLSKTIVNEILKREKGKTV